MAILDYTPVQLQLFPLDKRCSKCGLVKTIGAFRPYRPNTDGFKAYCTACDKAIYQARRTGLIRQTMQHLGCTRREAEGHLARLKASNRNELEAAGLKRCSECRSLKPHADYHCSKYQRDGLANVCKACVKAFRHAHYLANRERITAQINAWRQANWARAVDAQERRRKRKLPVDVATRRRIARQRRAAKHRAPGSHTQSEWHALCAACADVCACCGAGGALTEDHIVPISRGGSDWIDNIQPLCASCNCRKGTRTVRYIP